MAGAEYPAGPGPVGSRIPLTALAEGPFTHREGRPLTATLTVPHERLQAGPVGARIGLALGDGAAARRPPLSLTVDGGSDWQLLDRQPPRDLEALLADRAFLAQHVYAVASATLSKFESTLGRRMPWRDVPRLRISIFDRIPFEETGYERATRTVRFGHRRDERAEHHVPLGLYHDLVAHEVTHAVLDGYRPCWADGGATKDQFALHEAFADLVAMLSVFATPERVEQQLAAVPRGDGGRPLPINQQVISSGLFGLADGLFSRSAARRPLSAVPAPNWREDPEPHRRGEVVARAALEALHAVWSQRIAEPGGRSSRRQVALSGSSVGEHLLAILLRGLAYMPPVDPSWEDLLRGIIAADLVMVPWDRAGYREALRTSFGSIGVTTGPDETLSGVQDLAGLSYPVRVSALSSDPEEVCRFIWENPALIAAAKLDRDSPISVDRVRTSLRISPDGFVVSETGASFSQRVTLSRRDAARRLGLRMQGDVDVRGGGLLRFDEGGHLTYAALKTVMDPERQQAKYAAWDAEREDIPLDKKGTFHRVSGA